jgi:predicted nucleic acid-binding protein
MTASERFALDTNVLVYLFDGTDPSRQARARHVVDQAAYCGRCALSVQSVGELHTALRRRRLVAPTSLSQTVSDVVTLFPLLGIEPDDTGEALDWVAAGRLSYWDGLLRATVGRCGCTVLLSEDMQDGAMIGSVTVRNPFVGETMPDAVAALLA